MPIFEYKCEDCGKVSEVFQLKAKQENTIVCPDCGSNRMKRLMSSPASFVMGSSSKETTCCGREERCDTPPCSTDGTCKRDSD
ncbi:MAG: zinc ribbon domain-containing protein [candidate division Zixibacteria bacterium]|nr:zinc ribbon domain-containing protein [candidate division Zixibacteria bacterium]